MARVRPLTIIFITPLFFGLGKTSLSRQSNVIAHIHHAYEHNLHNPRSPLATIVVTSIQFTYTTIFGWYASYLFITTQTIWAPVVVHTFCNVMGLPRFWGGIPGVAIWKVIIYYVCLVLGLMEFIRSIGSIKPHGMEL
jgi:prenyl protein peptidase